MNGPPPESSGDWRQSMDHDELQTIAVSLEQMLESNSIVVPRADIVRFVHDLLWGPRELLGCLQAGIVTQEEVANAITSRAYTWAMSRAGRRLESVDMALSDQVVAAIGAEIAGLAARGGQP